MSLNIHRITNANVYSDDLNQFGQAEEINMGKLMQTMVEHKALGMKGKIELPAGFDKMEISIKWNSFYADTFKKYANPFKAIKIQVRASVEVWEGGDKVDEKPLVIYATTTSKGFPIGNFKAQDNVEYENDLACTQIKMEYASENVMEFDAMANILIIDGVDQFAAYRNNLGL